MASFTQYTPAGGGRASSLQRSEGWRHYTRFQPTRRGHDPKICRDRGTKCAFREASPPARAQFPSAQQREEATIWV